ncbi:unnamed protein product [Didymodactylos carnosus]|uniref:Uncharacterized protein n=1 Tax=Didymodactylos carnosus TaxID=1234261 RepID=A0A815UCI5_9BILA|nr:unnamed protein product [Didymodactylos carnosus]CAF4378531.1 unnamed protein product [Didymodactylos carnosus]
MLLEQEHSRVAVGCNGFSVMGVDVDDKEPGISGAEIVRESKVWVSSWRRFRDDLKCVGEVGFKPFQDRPARSVWIERVKQMNSKQFVPLLVSNMIVRTSPALTKEFYYGDDNGKKGI